MPKRFQRGLIIGKFCPPHKGHKHLIDTAAAECEALTVLLCWRKSQDIPHELRKAWLEELHPNARVLDVEDEGRMDGNPEGWAREALQVLHEVPDAVFSSETYGEPFARALGATHVLVDKERVQVPISGTMVRSNPGKYLDFLEPPVRAYFIGLADAG